MKSFTIAMLAAILATEQVSASNKYEHFSSFRTPGSQHDLDRSEILLNDIEQAATMAEQSIFSGLKCTACASATDLASWLFKTDTVTAILEKTLTLICLASGALGDRFKTCKPMIDQFYTPAQPVITDYLLTRERICSETFGVCRYPMIEEIDLNTVVDNILATKPVDLDNDNYVNNLYSQIAADTSDRETFLALHISDVHIDAGYIEGSLANCDEYLCCRAYSGYPKRKSDIPAGKWGSALCDLPVHTLQSMLDFVKSDLKPDMMFWTGDNSPHNVWYNTEQECASYTIGVTQMIQNTFKDMDLAVFPIQGNHDTWVEEIEDFTAPGINYPINHFKSYWAEWLDEEAMEKYGEYGYYSMEMKLLNGK